MERVDEAVGGDVEVLGGGREWGAAGGIGEEKAFAESAEDEELVGEGGGGRIEVGGLVALGKPEDLGGGRGRGGGGLGA